MNLGRTVVRFWLALAALAWLGGEARAAECGLPSQTELAVAAGSTATYQTEGEARTACSTTIGKSYISFVGGWRTEYTVTQCTVFNTTIRMHGTSTGRRFTATCQEQTGSEGAAQFHAAWPFLVQGCPNGLVWFGGGLNRCDTACNARPSQTTLFYPKPGSMTCERGCMRSFYANGDGETMTTQSTGQQCTGTLEDACAAIPAERGNFVRNPLLGVCEPVSPECPEGMRPVAGKCAPNDFCPVGQIVNENNVCEQRDGECPAGSTRALDGMCRSEDDDNNPNKCPPGQVKGSDGTCKPDTDDDGEADEGSDTGTFSGGDSCKVPPMCSGDAILCGQARIQWRIDCNTRRNQQISGGGCAPASMPVCVGESCDLMQYAQLVQAWNTRCAVEELARRESTGGGNDNGDPVNWDPTLDAAAVVEDTAGTAEPDDAFTDESANNGGEGGLPGGSGDLDTSGFGWSRSCPNLPSITVMDGTLDFNAVAGGSMCNWFQLAGQIVLILAAMLSLRILSSSTSV